MLGVGQNHLDTPYIAVYFVVFLAKLFKYTIHGRVFGHFPSKIPYLHRICMVLSSFQK